MPAELKTNLLETIEHAPNNEIEFMPFRRHFIDVLFIFGVRLCVCVCAILRMYGTFRTVFIIGMRVRILMCSGEKT